MKISYKSVSDILSPKEMRNISGGSGGCGGDYCCKCKPPAVGMYECYGSKSACDASLAEWCEGGEGICD